MTTAEPPDDSGAGASSAANTGASALTAHHAANSDSDSDSAGMPWAGRTLPDSGFGGDDGSADEALVSALAARAAHPCADHDRGLATAAAAARWIVPIVAAPTEVAEGGEGLAVERSTDMAVVTITSPDGRRALPVFTSAAALALWDASARPVPVDAVRAARSAVAEGCDVLVVDLGSPLTTEIRPSMVWALAQGQEWRPPHEDPFVARSVARAVSDEDAVVAHRVEEGSPEGAGVLRVVLVLVVGLDAASVQEVATRIGQRLATDGELRARVDGLTFTIEGAP